MPYSKDILSDISTRQQLQRQENWNRDIGNIKNKYQRQFDEVSQMIDKLQVRLNSLEPNSDEFKEINRLLQTQLNLQNSIINQRQEEINLVDEQSRKQEVEDRKRIVNLQRVVDREQEIHEFGLRNIQDKIQGSEEELKRINLLQQQNKLLLESNSLTETERQRIEEDNKELEKSYSIAKRRAEVAKEARNLFSSPVQSTKDFNENFNKSSGELKEYSRQLYILNKEKNEGRITEEQYRRLKETIDESLNPISRQIVSSIEKSGGNTDFRMRLFSYLSSAISTIAGLSSQIIDGLNKSVDSATSIFVENVGKVNARLYGLEDQGYTFTGLVDNIRSDIKASPYINQKQMIENVVKLTQSGIDYNLEQRALLLTLNDKLVPTFDALDSTLTRMIRLQQADVTLAQMGSEAALQRLLNTVFKDSSYLNDSGLYDTVYSAISESLSTQLNTDQSTQFAFAVQKWLGALYSVGMSSNAITGIANAVNLLGTGDINQLNGSQAQTLLALAANRAGISYSNILTTGLVADDVNKLMKSMVEYLQDIATNTSSQVVKSQWGDILNLEMSDWKAITNLTMEDISNLYNAAVTQQGAETEINNIMTNILPTRYHLSEQVQTALDNAVFSFAMGIADDQEKYAAWKLVSTLKGIGEQFLGESTLLNLISGVASLVMFKDDLFSIPANLWEILRSGDSSLGNVFSNYQTVLTRGGSSYSNVSSSNTTEDVQYGMSESSNLYRLENVFPEEEEDYFVGLSVDDIDSSVYEGHDGGASTVYNSVGGGVHGGRARSFEVLGLDNVDSDIISTTASDANLTTFQQQDEYQSATAQNVMSQENVLSRDINDLYSELFEKQTTPIRVSLAKVEEQGQLDLHIATLESIRDRVYSTMDVSVSGDVFSGMSSMRNA